MSSQAGRCASCGPSWTPRPQERRQRLHQEPGQDHRQQGSVQHLSAFGNILSCKSGLRRKGPKGYGFVHFQKQESAERAIDAMNGMFLNYPQNFRWGDSSRIKNERGRKWPGQAVHQGMTLSDFEEDTDEGRPPCDENIPGERASQQSQTLAPTRFTNPHPSHSPNPPAVYCIGSAGPLHPFPLSLSLYLPFPSPPATPTLGVVNNLANLCHLIVKAASSPLWFGLKSTFSCLLHR